MTVNKKFNQLRTDQVKIPRDTKAVETTVSQALKDGKVIADNGKAYNTVQAAQDAASSWIRLPPETFNENVVVDTAGLSVIGSGYGSVLDGTGFSYAFESVTVSEVTLANLKITNQSSTTNQAAAVGDNSLIRNVMFKDVADYCLTTTGANTVITNCQFKNTGTQNDTAACINMDKNNIISGNLFSKGGDTTSAISERNGVGCVISNNIIKDFNRVGIQALDDCTVYGNRVTNTAVGIKIKGVDNVIVNNRISGATNHIKNNGSSNLIQDNLTGSAN